MSAPNITTEILRAAGARPELSVYCTGGGCDYVVRNVGPTIKPVMAVLGIEDDAGSPEKLDEPATVTFYFNDNWDAGVSFRFETAEKAMDWMVAPQHCTTFGIAEAGR